MPILVHVDELEPGMRLFQAIYRGTNILLPAGKVLEEWEINSLRRRLPYLSVRVGDPVLDELVPFDDDSRDQEVAITVNRHMGGMLKGVREKLGAQTALEGSDIAGLQTAIAAVMQYIIDNPVTSAMLVQSGTWQGYFQEHAGNVFYLSLLVGNAIRDYVHQERQRTTAVRDLSVRYGMNLTPLALGCLFHDIGMIPLESLLIQTTPLTNEERLAIRQHPIAGAEALPAEMDAVARMVVRTHHENFDGTGYPESIPGHKLHVFSRVIRVADAFDAGTSHRIYRRAKSAAHVLWEMSAGPYQDHYDPRVVKILVGLVQPFPIGAKIRLNCGRIGVVVRHNRKHPFRPMVIIAFDENARKLHRNQLQPPIDLVRNPDVRLIEFAGDDLAFLNDSSADGEWTRADTLHVGEEESLFDYVYP